MTVWLTIGLAAAGLVGVALVVLLVDVARGDVGGGRHTLARARRLLVVSTDERTRAGAERWMEAQHRDTPDLQFLVLAGGPDEEALHRSIERALRSERPDAIVVARPAEEQHRALTGLYGRLKEEQVVPVDAIYVEPGTAA